jgi:general secretion pathway protein N
MAISRLIPPMRAFLLISFVLGGRAAADPIIERSDFRPHVEAGSPAAEGTSVAVAAPMGPGIALNSNAAPRSGNPLWAIPLSALTATRDRPLFSASRRPPIVAAPIIAPAQKPEALAPPPPERPLLTLVGTIVSRKASVAMLQGSNAEAISRLRVGQDNDGWRVQGIGLRSIVVEKGPQSVELGLPRADGSPAQ